VRNVIALTFRASLRTWKRRAALQHQPHPWSECVELLRDEDELEAMPVEELDQLGKITQGAGQVVDLF
jgi:hypothetical protein